MNITITGNLGSGKSSIGKILKEKGYEIVSTGNIFRQLAMDKGLSVEEFKQHRRLAENVTISCLIPDWHGILFRTVLRYL